MPSFKSFYKEYPCSYNSPLSCSHPYETAREIKGAKFCLECGFPATLPQGSEIKGNRGTYQVTQFLGERGLGRLYLGIQLQEKQPVVIKEYLLPSRSFNEDETRQRKATFKRVAGVNLVGGRVQNFRVVNTWEAIADEKGERCYLIAKETEPCETLSQYQIKNGAMSASEIREILNQSLQTLQFLHTQKLLLPSNQITQGLVHGNISLDSILIQVQNNQYFYIYLCDLAIWENLFVPPSFPQPTLPQPEQDLNSLGKVAFYLWVGRQKNPISGELLEPTDSQLWPKSDDALKNFLYQLIGLTTPFESAEAARQALLKLPKEGDPNKKTSIDDAEEKEKRFRRTLIFLLGVFAFLLLGGGIWYFWGRNSLNNESYTQWKALERSFSDVDNVRPGQFTYTGKTYSTWSLVLKKSVGSEGHLEDLLTNPKPEVKATFNYQPVNNPIEEVREGKKEFAITGLENNITDDLIKEKIADNGLVVFVAFINTNQNLPETFDGTITLNQLRRIYTGQIKNWQELGGPNLPIELYAPTETEALEQFQKLVFNNNSQQVALFKQNVTYKDTGNTLRQIVPRFEQGTGIISFSILSQLWGQCAGYPLAIVDDNNQLHQPMFRRRETRPLKPSDNICDHQNYFDVKTFQNYPLGYPLFVVYPKNDSRSLAGSTFTKMLKTRQGQCLLSKVGLVPLQPMPDLTSYDCKSVS
jgi:ABC-type phosphate transport system substrate-binding protein